MDGIQVNRAVMSKVGINNDFDSRRVVSETTPLHSALIQGNPLVSADDIICGRFSTPDIIYGRFSCSVSDGREPVYESRGSCLFDPNVPHESGEEFGRYQLDPLQLATLTGNMAAAKVLLQVSPKPLSAPAGYWNFD